MCGALAIRFPAGSKRAHEKSSRSRMLTDCAVDSKRGSHLLGGRHEQVVEDLEHHGIGGSPDARLGRGLDPLDQEVPRVRHRRPPTVVDDCGGVGLGDDRRPGHRRAGRHALALEQRRVAPLPLRPQPHRLRLAACLAAAARGDVAEHGEVGLLRESCRLHRDRLDDEATVEEEGVRPPVDRLERGDHRVRVRQLDGERVVGPVVAQVDAGGDADGRVRDSLGRELAAGHGAELRDELAHPVHRRWVERGLDGLLPHDGRVGQADAEGRQHAGQRRHDDGADAERVGDGAGVLASGAAERRQCIAGDVVALLHRDPLHGIGHVRDRDLQEPLGDLFGSALVAGLPTPVLRQLDEASPNELGVDRLVALRPEHPREVAGLDAAEHDVGVGHRQRSAGAIAGRARHRARRSRARRGSGSRRSGGWNRRRRRRCGWPASGPAGARRRPSC